jgi:hypothetical protein
MPYPSARQKAAMTANTISSNVRLLYILWTTGELYKNCWLKGVLQTFYYTLFTILFY